MKPSHATLVRARSGLCVALAAVCCVAAPAHAATVVVFNTSGPGGAGIAKAMAGILQEELADHDVRREARPRGWKSPNAKRARTIAEALTTAGADIGLDSMVSGRKKRRKLTVLAVTAGGEIIFDKATRLPREKPENKAASLARDIALALADQLDRAQVASSDAPPPDRLADDILHGGGASSESSEGGASSESSEGGASSESSEGGASSESSEGGASLESSEGGASLESSENELEDAIPATVPRAPIAPPEPAAAAILRGDSEVEQRSVRDLDQSKPFHFALRLGGGVLSYSDDIAANVEGGELHINLASTVAVTAGLEMQIMDTIRVDILVRRHAAKMTHRDPSNPAVDRVRPEVIDIAALGGTGLAGAVFDVGPIGIGAMAGASYDRLDAPAQTLTDANGVDQTVALVPSWARLMVLAGPTINAGNLGTNGFAAQLGLMAAPWGRNSEEPVTSGSSNGLLGGVGWLRLRYQLTDLLGSAGGVFAEVCGDIEYLKIQYEGIGTRMALGDDTPVQASKETRLSFSGGLSVGYIF